MGPGPILRILNALKIIDRMRKLVFLVLFIGIGFGAIALTPSIRSIEKVMRQIPESSVQSAQGIADYINSKFSGQSTKSRAIFIWIAKNIRYDTENMFVKSTYLNQAEIIDKTLKTKKGICFDYAILFNEIANKVGIKSYIVSGCTKQNGVVDTLPHSWCVALIDSKCFMFDPTWGSGGVQHSIFIKHTNYFYYKTKPKVSLESHMPFDPLWQLSYYPISNSEFYDISMQFNNNKSYFNFKDSISVYEKQSNIERLIASNYRIEKNRIMNSLILDQLEINRKEIAFINREKFELKFNPAVESCNNGNTLLNEFIRYYNKKFVPAKSDAKIQQMIDTVVTCINNSRKKLININIPDEDASLLIKQLNESIDKISVTENEFKIFLTKYFNTRPESRIYLFYTWKSQ
jgi:hypothetical protein